MTPIGRVSTDPSAIHLILGGSVRDFRNEFISNLDSPEFAFLAPLTPIRVCGSQGRDQIARILMLPVQDGMKHPSGY